MTEPPPLVVAISRQMASGGAYIGQRLAKRLGLHYVDREILRKAAEALGDDEPRVETMEEREAGLWERVSRAVSVGAPDAAFLPPAPPTFDEADVLDAETDIIKEIIAREPVVIVGRAAYAIRDRPNVIRVFVHAPKAIRVTTVQHSYALDADVARRMVEQSDARRAKFVKSIVDRPWTDARLYALTIDTSVIEVDLAVELLAAAINGRR